MSDMASSYLLDDDVEFLRAHGWRVPWCECADETDPVEIRTFSGRVVTTYCTKCGKSVRNAKGGK